MARTRASEDQRAGIMSRFVLLRSRIAPGLQRRTFALRLGIDPEVYRSWEAKGSCPSNRLQLTNALRRFGVHDPEHVTLWLIEGGAVPLLERAAPQAEPPGGAPPALIIHRRDDSGQEQLLQLVDERVERALGSHEDALAVLKEFQIMLETAKRTGIFKITPRKAGFLAALGLALTGVRAEARELQVKPVNSIGKPANSVNVPSNAENILFSVFARQKKTERTGTRGGKRAGSRKKSKPGRLRKAS